LNQIQNIENRQKKREIFNAYSNDQYKTTEEAAKVFKEINHKADRIDEIVVPKTNKSKTNSIQN
jgi:uncharacterized protein Yka (UPF0111/DUF47 family)